MVVVSAGHVGGTRGAGGLDTICTAVCNRRDSSTACRLCRLSRHLMYHLINQLIYHNESFITYI